jgi:sec-independent protein translocase protein TatA
MIPGLPAGAELIVILIIVLLVFGVGRIGKIGGELGSAIRQFREGLSGGEKKDESKPSEADKKED